MKLVVAIIKPFKLQEVREALVDAGMPVDYSEDDMSPSGGKSGDMYLPATGIPMPPSDDYGQPHAAARDATRRSIPLLQDTTLGTF